MWLTGHGGPDKLKYAKNAPVPGIAGNEMRIRIHACGLNHTGINTRTGEYSKEVGQRVVEDSARDGYAVQTAPMD